MNGPALIAGQLRGAPGHGRSALSICVLVLLVILEGCSAAGHFHRGAAHDRMGKAEEAIESYSRAIRADPGMVEAYYNRAIQYGRVGQPVLAMEDYEKALALRPWFAQAWNNFGVTLVEIGDDTLAVRKFTQAIEADPLYAEPHYNLGNAYARMGKPELAVRSYTRALQIAPRHAEALNNRAVANIGLGRIPEALEDFSSAIALFQRAFPLYDPQTARACWNRAVVYRAETQRTRAELDFARACHLGYQPACQELSRLRDGSGGSAR